MAAVQEAALDRLYRWTLSQCKNPEPSAMLPRAMKHLKTRPTLFKYAIDEYCGHRRGLLVRGFLDALGGSSRPIELQAHDPPRYVGDMLAWLHQAIPSETEGVKMLLNQCEDKDNLESECIANVTEDVCRPLRSRVEQVLLLESNAVVLYKLTGLVRFYSDTLKTKLPTLALLTETLKDLSQLAYKQFVSVLQATVNQQTRFSSTSASSTSSEVSLNRDLTPSANTMALLGLLKELLSGTSMVEEAQSERYRDRHR